MRMKRTQNKKVWARLVPREECVRYGACWFAKHLPPALKFGSGVRLKRRFPATRTIDLTGNVACIIRGQKHENCGLFDGLSGSLE
jgi:hypothetical protein